MGPLPLEQTIAEAFMKERLRPKSVKEQLEEKFLAEGPEGFTPEQLKIIGAYVSPEKGETTKEELEQKILTGELKVEDLSPAQQKILGVYIPPKKEGALTAYQETQEAEELKKVVGALKAGGYYLPGTFGALGLQDITTAEEAIKFLQAPPTGYEAYPQYEEVPEIMEVLRAKYPERFGVKKTGKYKIGEIIKRGGKQWKIVGFDNDGVPLVEEVK